MRIHITGPIGSGKTTLAKMIAESSSIPLYALDDIQWHHYASGDVRRPLEEKLMFLEKIVQTPNWIIEGVPFQWLDSSFQTADLIFFLDTPAWRNRFFTLKRFIKQKLRFEHSAYQPTFSLLLELLRWQREYQTSKREELLCKLEPYHHKVIRISSVKEGIHFLKNYKKNQ